MEEMWSPAAVTGYRIWSVRHDRLEGLHAVWRTSSFEASCGNHDAGEPVPHLSNRCACGVYATKQPAWLHSEFPGVDRLNVAMGRVRMWGRVIEHARGYRAQRAEVASIVVRARRGIWCTDDPERIAAMFAAPAATLASAPDYEYTGSQTLEDALGALTER